MSAITLAVEQASQVLTATLPLRGTPHSLVYRSDAVPGSDGSAAVTVPVDAKDLPARVDEVLVAVSVGDVTEVRSFEPADLPLDCVVTPFADEDDPQSRDVIVAVGYVAAEPAYGSDPIARTLEQFESRRSRRERANGAGRVHGSDDVDVAVNDGDESGPRSDSDSVENRLGIDSDAVSWVSTSVHVSRPHLDAGLGGWSLDARAPSRSVPSWTGVAPDGMGQSDDASVPTVDWAVDGRRRYEFDAVGDHRRTIETLTECVEVTFEDTDCGRLVAVADRSGAATRFERNAEGGVIAVVAPGGQRTALLVEEGTLRRVTTPGGSVVEFEYGTGGLLTAVVDPLGRRSTFEYDADGRVVARRPPSGDRIEYVRSETPFGHEVRRIGPGLDERVVSVDRTAPSGRRFTTHCCGEAPRTLTVDERTHRSEFPDGSLLDVDLRPDPWTDGRTRFPATLRFATPAGVGSVVETERTIDRGADGRLRRATETVVAEGDPFRVDFDAEAAEVTAVSPEGRTSRVRLDALSRPADVRTGDLAPVRYDYDDAGRLVAIAAGDDDPRRYAFEYEADGTLAAVTDPVGRRFEFESDADGNVVAERIPGDRRIGYEYDAAGQCIGLTVPSGESYRFDWTDTGLPAGYLSPAIDGLAAAHEGGEPDAEREQFSYAYDADGLLVTVTTPDGAVVVERDDHGRPRSVDHLASRVEFDYDDSGALASVEGPTGTVIATERDGGLPTTVAWSGPVTGRVSRTYGPGFRVAATRVNDDPEVEVTYDADGLVTGAGGMALDRSPETGLLVEARLDALVDRWEHDRFADVVRHALSLDRAVVREATYQRDALGRVTSMTSVERSMEDRLPDERAIASRTEFEYDEAGRLAAVRLDGTLGARYDYDGNGNRVRTETPDGSISADYDARDRLVRFGDVAFTYTDGGVLRTRTDSRGTTTYDYDLLGNLRAVDLPDGRRVEYVVDGHNRRIGKSVDGEFIAGWLYDGDRPVAEVDANGAVRSRFVYASNPLVPDYLVRDGRRYRLVVDHVGSPVLVVDGETGEAVQRREYDAFGVVRSETAPHFQPFGFAGGLYDSDTGLVRFGARDYLPEAGRFTAPDPLGFAGGDTNLYAYAASDPVNYVDPTGRWLTPDTALDIASTAYDAVQYANCPSKENAFALALDGISLAIPGLTGLSTVVRNVDDLLKFLAKNPHLRKFVGEGLELAIGKANELGGTAGRQMAKFAEALRRKLAAEPRQLHLDLGVDTMPTVPPAPRRPVDVSHGNPVDAVPKVVDEAADLAAARGELYQVLRKRYLGLDPARGAGKSPPPKQAFNLSEAEIATRLEKDVGPLERYPHTQGPDWIDARGRTYDALGPVPSQHFDGESFNKQISKHLTKSDEVVVNLQGLSKDQSDAVRTYVRSLSSDEQARIRIHE